MRCKHRVRIPLCFAIALTVVFSLPARAQTVSEQIEYDALGNFIRESTGVLATVGDRVRVGLFPVGFNFSANQTFASLDAAFTQFGTTTIGAAGSGTGAGQFSAVTLVTTPGFETRQLYIWVLNNNVAASATAWVILTDTATNWKVPPDTQGTIIDTSDATTVPSTTVFIPPGAFGIGVTNVSSPNGFDWKMTNFAAVPEPSTYALLGFGALAFIGFRRRIKI